jgi:hypothetical protein
LKVSRERENGIRLGCFVCSDPIHNDGCTPFALDQLTSTEQQPAKSLQALFLTTHTSDTGRKKTGFVLSSPSLILAFMTFHLLLSLVFPLFFVEGPIRPSPVGFKPTAE